MIGKVCVVMGEVCDDFGGICNGFVLYDQYNLG
jgi:hypothetical protein